MAPTGRQSLVGEAGRRRAGGLPSGPPTRRAGAAFRGRRRMVVAAAFLLAWPLPGTAAAQDDDAAERAPLPVTRFELSNGMRFLVLPRQGAPTLAFVARFDVGSADDPPGMSGMAHLLEHLLFKGSSTIGTTGWVAERFYLARIDAVADSLVALAVGEDGGARVPPPRDAGVPRQGDAGVPAGVPSAEAESLAARLRALEDSARAFVAPNEFAEILARNGARGLNAITDHDATTYFVELPSNRAELWFALEADRMADPVFREFYAERDVVLEERRLRVEDRAGGRLEEALLAEAYRVHPYGVPVAGTPEDLRRLTRRDVTGHHRRYYGPGNAIVAIVGDADPRAMRAFAERYFGQIEPGGRPPPIAAVESAQTAPRRVHVRFDAGPEVRLAWHTVSAAHPDAPALAVLASVLAGGVTSRLHRRLVVEDRSAVDVSAGGGPGEEFPGLFTVSAVPRAPFGPADVEAAVLDEVARISADPPAPRELAAVRNSAAMEEVERLSSNLGLAFQLTSSEALLGDWRRTFELPAELREVTAADVARVARTYLRPDGVTVATVGRGPEPRR